MSTADLASGPACPPTRLDTERIQLGHGSGGRLSAALLKDRFLPRFGNDVLARLGDGAVVPAHGETLVISTDGFVVQPLEFPGGNIGHLAIHGTLNDLAMMGAVPRYLAAGFVLEEGLETALLDRVLDAMAEAARAAGVPVITGDTKVVERGKADGLYVTTTGIGSVRPGFTPAPERARPGDVVLVSGPIGRHGIAVLSARNELGLDISVTSDTANLTPLVAALADEVGAAVHVLRDPTRGGLASALNEIASTAGVGVVLDEAALPVPDDVSGVCELLGLDPLYVANEGILVAFVAAEAGETALARLRRHPLGANAAAIGRVTNDHRGVVALATAIGGSRVVDMLPGDQLPRIC